MELRELECFLAVAEHRHFRHAAVRLRITQSQITRLINRLESNLGVRLFDRTTRRVDLTPAGQSLLPEARATLTAADQTLRVARSAARGGRVKLEIGTVSSMPINPIFARIIGSFRRSHPVIHFSIREMGIGQQIDGLVAQHLDLGFVRLPITNLPSTVDVVPIFSEPLMVALPEGHRLSDQMIISVEDMSQENFIQFTPQSGLYDLTYEACLRSGFQPRHTQSVACVPMAVSLVAAGFGVAFVPATFASAAMPGVLYRPLDDRAVVAQIAVIFRKAEHSAIVRRFVAVARSWHYNFVFHKPEYQVSQSLQAVSSEPQAT